MFYCDPISNYCYAEAIIDDDMTIDTTSPKISSVIAAKPTDVPLREGPPTREELLVHYPARFTWEQLKTFVNSGDLGLLKRDKKLQIRYDTWAQGIRAQYGSMVNYLLGYRLQWGQPDRRSVLKPVLDRDTPTTVPPQLNDIVLPPLPANAPAYFVADTPSSLISIISNDWPYSVPPEIEHTLVWTRMPIIPLDLPDAVRPRIHQDGLWGFTGSTSPPPSPSTLPACLPALADWGVTLDKLVCSPKGTAEEDRLVKEAGREIDTYIRRGWPEREWETAWFVNPPRLQSVPGLAHLHVFARHRTPDEIARLEHHH